MYRSHSVSASVCLVSMVCVLGCSSGSQGPAGPAGADGAAGPSGAAGAQGATGAAGASQSSGSALASVASLDLPGPAFFPSTLHAAADGTLFVGSVGTGEIVKFTPDSVVPTVIVPPADPQIVIAGIYVDDVTSTLYACTDIFAGPGFTNPTAELRGYDFSGTLKQHYALPLAGSECEDVTTDSKDNVYVTDSLLGSIYILASGSSALKPWVTSPLFAPNPTTGLGFGVHGITADGQGNLYVSNFDNSLLLRVAIGADGAAGAVTQVTVTPAIQSPEAIRMLDAKTLLVIEDTSATDGRLTKVTIGENDTATGATLRNNLQNPTSVAIAGGSYWVTEGQTSHLLDPSSGPPSLPFQVERETAE